MKETVEDFKVTRRLLCEVIRGADVPQTQCFGVGHVTVYQNLAQKAYRITVEEVEVLPEVRVGQIWRQNTDGGLFVVVALSEGEVGFARLRPDKVMLVLGKCIPPFRKEFTLIQDVVGVTK